MSREPWETGGVIDLCCMSRLTRTTKRSMRDASSSSDACRGANLAAKYLAILRPTLAVTKNWANFFEASTIVYTAQYRRIVMVKRRRWPLVKWPLVKRALDDYARGKPKANEKQARYALAKLRLRGGIWIPFADLLEAAVFYTGRPKFDDAWAKLTDALAARRAAKRAKT